MDDFEEFLTAELAALLRFATLLTGDPHRADDLVQAALVRTMRRWRHIDHEHPAAYVRRAIVNANNSWWRRSRRETALTPDWDVAAASNAERAYDDQDLLARALDRLPPRQRAVVVLRYYDGLSEAEIADTLGCSAGTVKSQASKAMRTLRRVLTTDGDTHTLEGAAR